MHHVDRSHPAMVLLRAAAAGNATALARLRALQLPNEQREELHRALREFATLGETNAGQTRAREMVNHLGVQLVAHVAPAAWVDATDDLEQQSREVAADLVDPQPTVVDDILASIPSVA